MYIRYSYDVLSTPRFIASDLGYAAATDEPPEPERSHAERSGGVGGGVQVSCRRFLCQYKVGEVFKQPFVLERSIDDSQKFTSKRDDRFPGPAAFLFFVVVLQVRTISLRDQGALHQCGSAQIG